MATDVKLTNPKEYYRTFLEQNVRPDGRELGEIRSTTLNVGSISTAEGSALVKLGNTTIICGVKAELTTPKSESPKQGFIVPNVDLPPLCSAQFRPGPPSEQAQVTSVLMNDIIVNSKCIDLEELLVVEGKLCWVIYCDLMCLDYDGNIQDACVISMIAALKNALLPQVTLDEETGLPTVDFKVKKPLKIHNHPVATSFAIFEDTIIFTDPTNEEENLATGVITIVTKDDKSLCLVHKPGGSPVSPTQLQNCIILAQERGHEVRQLIEDSISTLPER